MAASTSLNSFALDLFNVLRESSPDENALISPISIVTALSMTLLGAKANTEKQMVECMKIDGKKLSEWHTSLGGLLTSLKSGGDGRSAMNVANKVFVEKSYEVLQSYTDALTKLYKSEHGSVNFKTDSAGAVKTINDWVKQETKDNIPKLFEEIDALTRVILVNAVHFKGFWKDAFEKDATTENDFHINSKKTIQVKMMNRELKKIPYGENADAMVIQLPFKEDGYSMSFILPKETHGLKALEDKLLKNKSTLDAFLNSTSKRTVYVSIPKFQMRNQMDLVTHLSGLGMKDLFDESQCNLSGVSGNRDLHVSAVIHEACLDVTEEGAEAAAATAVQMVMFCAAIDPSPVFYADHPFLVLISHKDSVLFIGRVMEPKPVQ